MENNTHNNFEKMKKNVLDKIQAGEIHMRPKVYFTLGIIVLGVLSFITLVLSAFLVSYILFVVRASGQLFLLGFGFRGILVFLTAFPWLMLVIDILLIILLDTMVKKFRFGYRQPFVILAAGTFVVVIAAGTLIYLSPLHQALEARAHHQQLPSAIGGFYMHARRPPREQGVVKGVVVAIKNSTFTIEDDDSDTEATTTHVVIVPPNTDLNLIVHVGDRVVVGGTLDHEQIHAYGIQNLGSAEY